MGIFILIVVVVVFFVMAGTEMIDKIIDKKKNAE
jgi:hypothetical protein